MLGITELLQFDLSYLRKLLGNRQFVAERFADRYNYIKRIREDENFYKEQVEWFRKQFDTLRSESENILIAIEVKKNAE